MIYNGLAQLVGGTPLFELVNYRKANNLKAGIFAKLEYFNPTGSAKDRAVKYMLEAAFSKGDLKRGGTVIEPTSGNTGISLAAFGRAAGLRVILTMPSNMSVSRQKIMRFYGAKLILTEPEMGMAGAIRKAEKLREEISGSIVLGQFENPANPLAHYETTAPEIWNETRGNCDIFVAGAGTGGTLSGAGKYLKEKNPAIKIYAAEPEGSPVLSKGKSGLHAIQGIGAGFVPKTLTRGILEGVITVSDESAAKKAEEIARTDGLFAGISSGAALQAATELACRPENFGKSIITVFPDGAFKYLS
ncbi:MAG: cysteine synthase A [Clostridia bacterium]|nr:cysteine synthase A [Clostridia bacterium]